MMKKVNLWLKNAFRHWDYDTDEQGCYVLWFALISFLTLFVGQFILHNVALFFSILCLGLTFIPPIVLGIRCLIKKEKFNPLYWFLGIKGLVYGGLLACLVLFTLRGLSVLVSAIIALF